MEGILAARAVLCEWMVQVLVSRTTVGQILQALVSQLFTACCVMSTKVLCSIPYVSAALLPSKTVAMLSVVACMAGHVFVSNIEAVQLIRVLCSG